MVKKKLWVERLLTGDRQFSRRLPFQITLPHGHVERLNVARKAFGVEQRGARAISLEFGLE
jgi:hypothetical protein